MSVKAREIVKKESFTYKQLLIIFGLLFVINLLIEYIRDRVSENLQITINISFTMMTIVILTLLILKVLPRYELMVLDNDFVIYKTILKSKLIFAVPLYEIISIEKKYERNTFKGKTLKYTIWNIKDRLTYVILFNKDGKDYNVHFQASKKFIDKLDKTVIKRKQQ